MFRAFLWFCLYSLIISCTGIGDFLEKPNIVHEKEIARIRKGTPIKYPRADPECNETNALDRLGDESGNIKVWISRNGVMTRVSIPIPAVSGHGLESEAIADTVWGHEISYDMECKTQADGVLCKAPQTKIHSPGQRLFFCRKDANYPRESLENAALASMIGIIKTYSVQKSLFPEEKIPKLTLLIHPLIIDHHYTDNEEIKDAVSFDIHHVRTDNAFLFSREEGNYIAALPTSVEFGSRKRASEPHIWEVPSIMSHEYGHHIFHHYAPSLANQRGDDQVSQSPYLDLAKSAINEGFADLLAYFTFSLEYPEFGWFSLHNTYFNREVSKSECSDGTKKKLDEWFLHHYLHQTPNLPQESIHTPDPTDNHALGAILAHGLFRIFGSSKQFTKMENPQLREAYRRTIAWSAKMQSSFEEDCASSPGLFLQKSLEHSISLLKEEGTLFAEQCTALHEVFPVFPELARTCQDSLERH